MQETVTKCDICGKKIEPNESTFHISFIQRSWYDTWYALYDDPSGTVIKDSCELCKNKIINCIKQLIISKGIEEKKDESN